MAAKRNSRKSRTKRPVVLGKPFTSRHFRQLDVCFVAVGSSARVRCRSLDSDLSIPGQGSATAGQGVPWSNGGCTHSSKSRSTWSIELFFRFFKQLLGCRRLFFHNENGIKLFRAQLGRLPRTDHSLERSKSNGTGGDILCPEVIIRREHKQQALCAIPPMRVGTDPFRRTYRTGYTTCEQMASRTVGSSDWIPAFQRHARGRRQPPSARIGTAARQTEIDGLPPKKQP